MLCYTFFMGNILQQCCFQCFQAICCKRYSAPAVAQLIQNAATRKFPFHFISLDSHCLFFQKRIYFWSAFSVTKLHIFTLSFPFKAQLKERVRIFYPAFLLEDKEQKKHIKLPTEQTWFLVSNERNCWEDCIWQKLLCQTISETSDGERKLSQIFLSKMTRKSFLQLHLFF